MKQKKGFAGTTLSVLTSMKTAVILILIIIILSILGSLIPQGGESDFYISEYGQAAGNLIVSAHFHNFFRSWLFLIVTALFFINLAACSILRLYKRIKRRAPLRMGPDIIHLSLLLIIILGVFVLFTRQETTVMLEAGESFILPDDTEISLISFDIQYYDDGRPSDWVSRVRLKNLENSDEYYLEVNKPLTHGAFRVFQSSFDLRPHAIIDDGKHTHEMNRRDGLPVDGGTIYLIDVREADGEMLGLYYFSENTDSREYDEVVLAIGDSFRGLIINDLSITKMSGLQIVYQPGNSLILAVLLLFCVGLAVTFYQKLGDGIA